MGGIFFFVQGLTSVSRVPSKEQQTRVPFRKSVSSYQGSQKIVFGELRSLAVSNLFFK